MMKLQSVRVSHGATTIGGTHYSFGFARFRFVLTGIARCAQFRSTKPLLPVLPYGSLRDLTSRHYGILHCFHSLH